MARVPPVSQQNVSPAPLPLPYAHPSATPEQFGAGIGNVVEQATRVVGGIAQDELQKADTAAVLGASTKAQQALNDIVLDPDKGYLSLKGKDAVDGRDQTIQKFNQAIKDAGDELNSDSQRLRFAQQAKGIQEQGYLRVLHHEGVESDRFMQAQFRGKVDQTMVTLESPAIVSDPKAMQDQIDALFQSGIEEARRRYGQNAGKDAIASVVVPELQKAALGGMEAAVATQDPAIAKQALDKLGHYLVTNHQRFYANVVQKMGAAQEIGRQAGAAVGTGLTEVALPGGGTIMRPDANKISEAIAGIKADDPHRDEIVAATDKRQKAYDENWGKSVAKVAADALTAGLDPATGKFDISKVSRAYTEWLRVNAPDKLVALGKEDARASRGDNKADRLISAENYSDALTSLYDPAQKDTLLNTSMQQFQSALLDEQKYPGGFTPQDRAKLTKQFGLLQKQNFDEKVGATVKEELRKAFAGDTEGQDRRFGELSDRANAYARQYQTDTGKTPKTEEIRAYVVQQLTQEPGSGLFGSDFGAKRRIDLPRQIVTPPTAAATPAAAAPAAYRYSQDRKLRFPVDAQGNRVGPNEVVP